MFVLSFSWTNFSLVSINQLYDVDSNSVIKVPSLNKIISDEVEQSLKGSLMIIWDGPNNPGLDAAYYLSTLDGKKVEIRPSPDLLKEFQSFTLSHHELIVYGHWDTDHSTFIVNRFERLPLVLSDNTDEMDETNPEWIIDPPKITGNTPWITVLCKFPDIPDEPYDLNYYQGMYSSEYPGLDHFWREVSNNTINLSGSTAVGWYTLPRTSNDYLSPFNYFKTMMALEDCIAAADEDVNFNEYYGVNLMFSQMIGNSFAIGSCGEYLLEGEYRDAGITWTFPAENGGLANLAHEMGHGFCLPHSFINDGVDPYRNVWDLMSSAYGSSDPIYGYMPKHTIALNKYNLGWIEDSKVFVVDKPFNQRFTLGRSAQPQTNDYQMIKILIDNNLFFTLETRQTIFWYERDLPANAVIIHKYDYNTDKISFIDADYDNVSSDEESYWTVGETYVDPEYGLTFTIVGTTETGFTIDLTFTDFVPFEGCSSQGAIPIIECNALVSIYTALDGPNWVSARGWLIHPNPCLWAGVKCTDGVVTTLELLTELNGEIPVDIKNLIHLERLRLESESMTGEIPTSIDNLVNLKSLILLGNLTGSIPSELWNLNSLEYLDLRSNQLSGSIPSKISNLSNLTNLDLFGNNLTGSIPPELGMLNQLRYFRFSNNHLTGTLPPELGNLNSIVSINIDNNQLYGLIPMSFTQLTNIWTFSFRNTYLCEPADPEYQEWKDTYIPYNYFNEGVVCVESFIKSYIPMILH